MNCKLQLLLAAVVVVALTFVDAQGPRGRGSDRPREGGPGGFRPGGKGPGRPGPGGKGPRGPKGPGGPKGDGKKPHFEFDGDNYNWQREVATGVTIDEKAFAPTDKNVVVVISAGPALREQNLSSATTLYDFNGTSPVVAIKIGFFGPCFLVDTALTYEGVIADLTARNDSTVSSATEVALNGTVTPLSDEEKDALFDSNPALRFHCRRGPVVVTEPADAGAAADPAADATKDHVFFTLDSKVTLTVPERPQRPEGGSRGFGFGRFFGGRFGPRSGGGRGGRRGERNGGGEEAPADAQA